MIARYHDWLKADCGRGASISHGGPGGKWYCCLYQNGESVADGVGKTEQEAINDAMNQMNDGGGVAGQTTQMGVVSDSPAPPPSVERTD